MSVSANTESLPDSYYRLVKMFPLAHIKDKAHLALAQKMIDSLLQQDLDEGGVVYLDALTDLVELHEDKNEPIPDALAKDVLRELMTSNQLSQQKLAKLIGISQSTISAVLNDTRDLTLEQMVKLSKHFHISINAFIGVR